MLSDEENKMLEIFKKEVEKEQNEYEQVNEYTKFYYNNHKFILNLIEKQSKEIKELKKQDLSNSKIIANMSTRHFNDREKIRKYEALQDKIKAKIEYYEKIDNPVGKRVLQSLLEKE